MAKKPKKVRLKYLPRMARVLDHQKKEKAKEQKMSKTTNRLDLMKLVLVKSRTILTKMQLRRKKRKILPTSNCLGKCLNLPRVFTPNMQIPLKPNLKYVWSLNLN